MDLFKERLKETVKNIVVVCLTILFFVFIIWGVYFTQVNSIAHSIVQWMVYGFLTIVGILFVLGCIFAVSNFIFWLFIEPYMDWKKKNTPSKECEWCNGSGYDQEHGYKCGDCNGTGRK